MADVKRLVEERHGAIDVLKTWVPRVALAIVWLCCWVHLPRDAAASSKTDALLFKQNGLRPESPHAALRR